MSINYEQAWKDLRNTVIEMLNVKDEDVIYTYDLKKAMDEMIYDYKD
jgi:hypothetical protein